MTGRPAIIEERMQRWRDFYDFGKPPHHLFFIYCEEDCDGPPLPIPEFRQQRIDWACKRYEHDLKRAEWLDDDWIPHLYGITGTEVFAEAFGCPVYFYETKDQNPAARPLIHAPGEVAGLKVPDLDSGSMARHFEYHDEVHRRVPEALLQVIDIQSPMDIAALIWEKTSFYMGIVDAPEAVKELADKTRQLLVAYFEEFFGRYGRDYIAHYPSYYMNGGITLSEDEVGAVSPEMFEEFFLPPLVSLSKHFDGMGMHCCADSRHQWDHFLRIPNLRLLNLVRPDMETLEESFRFFAAHSCAMHDGITWQTPEEWLAGLPEGCRAVITVTAGNRAEAMERSATLREACRRRH